MARRRAAEDAPSGGGGAWPQRPAPPPEPALLGPRGPPAAWRGGNPGAGPASVPPPRPLPPLRAPSRRPGSDETGQGGRAGLRSAGSRGDFSLSVSRSSETVGSGGCAPHPTRGGGSCTCAGRGRGRGAPAPGTRRGCCRPGSRPRAARPSTLGRAGGRSRPPRVPRAFQSRHRPATARTRLGTDGDTVGQTTRQARASQPQGPPKRRVDPLLRSGTGRRWERVSSERASPRELGPLVSRRDFEVDPGKLPPWRTGIHGRLLLRLLLIGSVPFVCIFSARRGSFPGASPEPAVHVLHSQASSQGDSSGSRIFSLRSTKTSRLLSFCFASLP
ncbi:uncharacterized protein [Tursiops truncatus]|uniref:uncharacterized protein n=1 Tax=Tursiops truncatus TaxID=9739 RepID=UPI003CCFDA34